MNTILITAAALALGALLRVRAKRNQAEDRMPDAGIAIVECYGHGHATAQQAETYLANPWLEVELKAAEQLDLPDKLTERIKARLLAGERLADIWNYHTDREREDQA